MKKTILFLSLTLFFGALACPAFASLGLIKPDSKIYFIQPVLESVRMFFTFSKEAKAEYLIELADRRAEEMDIAPVDGIAERYVKHFQKLEEVAGEAPAEKKDELAEKIREASLRQQEVLAGVYVRVPEPAEGAILNAQERSSKHVERIIESVQGPEEAQDFAVRAAEIRQFERAAKQQRIRQAPMEGSPQANPAESVPRGLNAPRGLNPTQGLNPLNPPLETNEEDAGQGGLEPAAPVPMESPAAPL